MFQMNPKLTIWHSLFFVVWGSICLFLVLRWVPLVWRSSPQQFNDYLNTLRPKSWKRWYLVNFFWYDQDRHPSRVLWEHRIWTIFGFFGSLLFIVVGILIFAKNVL